MAEFYNNEDSALSYLPLARKRSAGGALSQKNADDAFKRFMELSSGKDDYSQAQLQAIERSRQANMDDSLAIAAQYAGPKFAGMQDSYLKRAMAGREPTRVGNVMIGPDGTVVSDPAANRTKQAELQLRLVEKYGQDANRDEQRADRNYQIDLNEDQRIYQRNQDKLTRARQEILDVEKRTSDQLTRDRQDRIDAEGKFINLGDRTLYNPTTQETVDVPIKNLGPPQIIPTQPKIITPDLDATKAVGTPGAYFNAVNKIGDIFASGDPNDPTRKSTAALNALAQSTMVTMSKAYPGKDTNYVLKKIDNLIVHPNEIFGGSRANSINKTISMVNEIQDAIDRQTNIINNPRAHTESDVSDAGIALDSLRQLKLNHSALLEQLQRPENDMQIEQEFEDLKNN